jgi:hypothetical protein
MSTTAAPDRFTTLPDEHALQATVVALEEHGFSRRSQEPRSFRAERNGYAGRR